MYADYVRTGFERDMDTVLYHNALDLVTLFDLALPAGGVMNALSRLHRKTRQNPHYSGVQTRIRRQIFHSPANTAVSRLAANGLSSICQQR